MELREQLQQTIGSAYAFERELKSGGMSRIFVAEEIELGRKVVVKVLSGDLGAILSAERFAKEVRLAASLQHPNIVPILRAGTAGDLPYYTMPYISGESVRSRVQHSGPLTTAKAISILRDVACALEFAHAAGIVHRDIKPENVLLAGDAAVVIDFGIAKALSASRTDTKDTPPSVGGRTTLTVAGTLVGTPAYMAPEQVSGDSVDARTDIYAWGHPRLRTAGRGPPLQGQEFGATANGRSCDREPAVARAANAEFAISGGGARDALSAKESRRPAAIGPRSARLARCDFGCSAGKTDLRSSEDADNRRRGVASRSHAGRLCRTRQHCQSIRSAGAGELKDAVPRGASFFQRRRRHGECVLCRGNGRRAHQPAYESTGITRCIENLGVCDASAKRDLDVREIGKRLGVSAVLEGTVRRSSGRLRVTTQLTSAADGLTSVERHLRA